MHQLASRWSLRELIAVANRRSASPREGRSIQSIVLSGRLRGERHASRRSPRRCRLRANRSRRKSAIPLPCRWPAPASSSGAEHCRSASICAPAATPSAAPTRRFRRSFASAPAPMAIRARANVLSPDGAGLSWRQCVISPERTDPTFRGAPASTAVAFIRGGTSMHRRRRMRYCPQGAGDDQPNVRPGDRKTRWPMPARFDALRFLLRAIDRLYQPTSALYWKARLLTALLKSSKMIPAAEGRRERRCEEVIFEKTPRRSST